MDASISSTSTHRSISQYSASAQAGPCLTETLTRYLNGISLETNVLKREPLHYVLPQNPASVALPALICLLVSYPVFSSSSVHEFPPELLFEMALARHRPCLDPRQHQM